MVLQRNVRPIIVAALSAMLLAALGGLNTTLDAWYYNLLKPTWQPPDWLFGPAWTLIFSMAAIAGVTYWRDEHDGNRRLQMLAAFALNGCLNLTWSLLFFRLRRPDWALYEVGFLWLSIGLLILLTRRANRVSPWLLSPYLAWVSFAAVLNWKIVSLNLWTFDHG